MILKFFWFLVTGFLVTAPNVLACSVCFGNPDSPQSKALGVSVLFLLGTVGSVWGGILYTIMVCARRAKKLAQLTALENSEKSMNPA